MFPKDENRRMDYSVALLVFEAYFGDQFEYLSQVDIVIFASGSGS